MLVGVTYLFAIARANGTTDWLVHAAIRLVRGRVALIPWVMFVLTGALTAIGAVSPAAVAIVAPIALSFAARYGISPLLMGAMVVHGAQGGGFSPISIYGSIVNGIVERENLPGNEIALFLACLVVNLVIAAVVFVAVRRAEAAARTARDGRGRRRPGAPAPATAPTASSTRVDRRGRRRETRTTDAGRERPPRARGRTRGSTPPVSPPSPPSSPSSSPCSPSTSTPGSPPSPSPSLLSACWPEDSRKAVGEIAWPTVLLICGVLTYVGVLEEMGTIDWAGEGVSDIGVPLLAARAALLHRRASSPRSPRPSASWAR